MYNMNFIKTASEGSDPKETAPKISIPDMVTDGEKGKIEQPKGETAMPKVGPGGDKPSPAMEGPKGDIKASADTVKITKEVKIEKPVEEGEKEVVKPHNTSDIMPKMKGVQSLGDTAPVTEGEKGKLLSPSGETANPSVADNMPKTEKPTDYANSGEKGSLGKGSKPQMPTEVPTEMVKGGDEFITPGEKGNIKAGIVLSWVKQSEVEKTIMIKAAFKEIDTLIKTIAHVAGVTDISKSSLKKIAEDNSQIEKAFGEGDMDAVLAEDEENPVKKDPLSPELNAVKSEEPEGSAIITDESFMKACEKAGITPEDGQKAFQYIKNNPEILKQMNISLDDSSENKAVPSADKALNEIF